MASFLHLFLWDRDSCWSSAGGVVAFDASWGSEVGMMFVVSSALFVADEMTKTAFGEVAFGLEVVVVKGFINIFGVCEWAGLSGLGRQSWFLMYRWRLRWCVPGRGRSRQLAEAGLLAGGLRGRLRSSGPPWL